MLSLALLKIQVKQTILSEWNTSNAAEYIIDPSVEPTNDKNLITN